jgi:hypothetical protein
MPFTGTGGPVRRQVVAALTAFVAPAAVTALVLASSASAAQADDARKDHTPPNAPSISSSDFPPNGPTTVTVGQQGSFTLTATDPGPDPSGIASFNYNLDGTSLVSGGSGEHNIAARHGTASVSLALSDMHWGTNTLWAQSVDHAGNVSQPVHCDFYVQQSAFGPYLPGTAGDVDGDHQPDLVTVDAAGNVRLFSNPDSVPVDPTGDTGTDPLQYGGRVLIPYTRAPLYPGGTFAGALVAHAGSFSGSNVDDLIIEENHTDSFTGPDGSVSVTTSGALYVAQNPNGTGTNWDSLTVVTKPACSTCANYNSFDWSSVVQLAAVPTTAGGPPALLTVEEVNGVASLWLYPPAHGRAFNAPTLVSTGSGSWQWDAMQIVDAGPLPGLTGTALWVRDPQAGALYRLSDIEAGIPDPNSAAVALATTGYGSATVPLLTGGRVDGSGNLPLWGTDAAGRLEVIATTTASGTTTVRAPHVLSGVGWAAHEQALQASYAWYNNEGIADSTGGNTSFDATDATDHFAYADTALGAATLDNGTVSACPSSTTVDCPAGVPAGGGLGVPLTNGVYAFALPSPWAHRPDNYVAAGQVLPAPYDANSSPAQYIAFLGTATTSSDVVSGTATITYTDGHTQQIAITFADWRHDTDAVPVGGNTEVASTAYRYDIATGARDDTPTYLFASAETQLLDGGAPLSGGVQIASITLPANSGIHIFSAAVN